MTRTKTDGIQDTINMLFPEGSSPRHQPSIEGLGAKAGFRPTKSRFEAKADETTRMVREMTDQATEQRQAKTVALRAARLQKESEDREAAAAAPARKPVRARKPKSAPTV
jgi:hypothetical protein